MWTDPQCEPINNEVKEEGKRAGGLSTANGRRGEGKMRFGLFFPFLSFSIFRLNE